MERLEKKCDNTEEVGLEQFLAHIFLYFLNKSVGIALRKGLRKLENANEEPSDTNIGLAMKRLYEMLQDGEYKDAAGQRKRGE